MCHACGIFSIRLLSLSRQGSVPFPCEAGAYEHDIAPLERDIAVPSNIQHILELDLMVLQRGVLDAIFLRPRCIVNEDPAPNDALLGPVLQTNPVVPTVIDLLNRRAAIEYTLFLPRNRLRKVS